MKADSIFSWHGGHPDSLSTYALFRGISVERSETTSARTLAVLAALWRRMAAAEAPSATASRDAAEPVSDFLKPGVLDSARHHAAWLSGTSALDDLVFESCCCCGVASESLMTTQCAKCRYKRCQLRGLRLYLNHAGMMAGSGGAAALRRGPVAAGRFADRPPLAGGPVRGLECAGGAAAGAGAHRRAADVPQRHVVHLGAVKSGCCSLRVAAS